MTVGEMSTRDEIITELDYLERELEACKVYDTAFPICGLPVGEYKIHVLLSIDRQNERMAELNRKEIWEKEQLENEK